MFRWPVQEGDLLHDNYCHNYCSYCKLEHNIKVTGILDSWAGLGSIGSCDIIHITQDERRNRRKELSKQAKL